MRYLHLSLDPELLRPDGSRTAIFVLDVSPDPTKLGRDILAQMVRELWEGDPLLVLGSEPATNPIGDIGHSRIPGSRLRGCGAMHQSSGEPLMELVSGRAGRFGPRAASHRCTRFGGLIDTRLSRCSRRLP